VASRYRIKSSGRQLPARRPSGRFPVRPHDARIMPPESCWPIAAAPSQSCWSWPSGRWLCLPCHRRHVPKRDHVTSPQQTLSVLIGP